MTEAKEKLDEVHVDLWRPHYPPSLSGKTYAAILVDKHAKIVGFVFTIKRRICGCLSGVAPCGGKTEQQVDESSTC